MHTHIHTCTHRDAHIASDKHTHTHIHLCALRHRHIHVHTDTYTLPHRYTHTETLTPRHTHIDTDTCTYTDTLTHRHIYTHTDTRPPGSFLWTLTLGAVESRVDGVSETSSVCAPGVSPGLSSVCDFHDVKPYDHWGHAPLTGGRPGGVSDGQGSAVCITVMRPLGLAWRLGPRSHMHSCAYTFQT